MIAALTRANSLVSSTTVEAVTLDKLLQNEIGTYSSLDRLRPQIELRGETARSVSLIIHELTTNAAEYGSLSKNNGVLNIRWSENAGYCHLRWREVDGPPVVVSDKSGFGTKLILGN